MMRWMLKKLFWLLLAMLIVPTVLGLAAVAAVVVISVTVINQLTGLFNSVRRVSKPAQEEAGSAGFDSGILKMFLSRGSSGHDSEQVESPAVRMVPAIGAIRTAVMRRDEVVSQVNLFRFIVNGIFLLVLAGLIAPTVLGLAAVAATVFIVVVAVRRTVALFGRRLPVSRANEPRKARGLFSRLFSCWGTGDASETVVKPQEEEIDLLTRFYGSRQAAERILSNRKAGV